MSGIFGFCDSRQNSSVAETLTEMATVMTHFPWYEVDSCSIGEGLGGLGRIGIGIFNSEPQPVFSANKSLALVFSGELYHTETLRFNLKNNGYSATISSDADLVLALYQCQGEAFINALEGAFSLAIWDAKQQTLLIANDRFGLNPLYYAHFNGKFVFAPEIKGILCHPDFNKTIDKVALSEYMAFQFLLGDKTFFNGLKLLPNASLLKYNGKTNSLAIQPYWDFSHLSPSPPTLSFSEAVEEGGRLLKAAVDTLSSGNYQLGLYLSGGVDARVILGLLEPDLLPLNTVSFGAKNCRDVVYAQQLADIAGTNHYFFEFTDGNWVAEYANLHLNLTEGFHSWIHSHGISILSQTKPLMEVNLTGFGGGQTAVDWNDPLLLNPPDDIAFTVRLYNLLAYETTWPSMSYAENRLLFNKDLSHLAFDSLQAELKRYNHLPPAHRAAWFALCNPDRRLFQYYTVFHRSHIEQRYPFYDYAYLDFVYSLPYEMNAHRKLRKAIILNRMPALAKTPYDKDNLPLTINPLKTALTKTAYRSKRFINRRFKKIFPEYTTLYADYENWLRNELYDWGYNLLLGERTRQRGLFNSASIASLWKRHQSGLEVNTIGKLAPIMTYEMMLRKFAD